MPTSQVTKDSFQAEVLDHKGIVFVDFYADWCAPCKVTEPIIDKLSDEIGNVKFVKMDVDKNPETASQYSVFSIPTFVIFKGGAVANQFVGAQSKESFEAEIKKVTG